MGTKASAVSCLHFALFLALKYVKIRDHTKFILCNTMHSILLHKLEYTGNTLFFSIEEM